MYPFVRCSQYIVCIIHQKWEIIYFAYIDWIKLDLCCHSKLSACDSHWIVRFKFAASDMMQWGSDTAKNPNDLFSVAKIFNKILWQCTIFVPHHQCCSIFFFQTCNHFISWFKKKVYAYERIKKIVWYFIRKHILQKLSEANCFTLATNSPSDQLQLKEYTI